MLRSSAHCEQADFAHDDIMTGSPIRLSGTPRARGRAQADAAGPLVAAVRDAVRGRLAEAEDMLARADVRAHLAALHARTAALDASASAELAGLAEGYGLADDALFAMLHLAVAADWAGRPQQGDGCTAWARGGANGVPLVVKNRDYGGRWPLPSAVFHLSDPTWRGAILCVGSLGAPGVYSSGINADGLALADTHIAARDTGVGLLRYFVMTRVLAQCADVEQALAVLRALPHAGGGSLVLADRSGAIAAVELGHRALAVERGDDWVARTNHFVSPELAAATRVDQARAWTNDNSHARLAAIRSALAQGAAREAADRQRAVMASHDRPGEAGLCRHGGGADSVTLSTAIYDIAAGQLEIAEAPPCKAPWARYAIAATPPAAPGGD
jgi:hypothetical protein